MPLLLRSLLINLQNHFFCALAVLIFFDWQGSPFNDLLLKTSLEKNISLKSKMHAVGNFLKIKHPWWRIFLQKEISLKTKISVKTKISLKKKILLKKKISLKRKIYLKRKISLAEAASRPRCRKALGLCAAAQMENLTVGKIGCWRNL